MNQPPQMGKRIVSKGTYVKAAIRQICVGVAGILGIVIGGLLLCYLLPVYLLLLVLPQCSNGFLMVGTLLLVLVSVSAGYRLTKKGETWIDLSNAIDTVVPLTRANTADLPDPDSLVRASEEPVQEQQTVLLRAAAARQERHEEQLVRALGKQELL